jgi:hypothetical protein
MATVLFEDEWVAVSVDAVWGVVRHTRSAAPYKDIGDLERSLAAIRAAAPAVAPGMKLLIDIRLAPARNDTAFEARTSVALTSFAKRF